MLQFKQDNFFEQIMMILKETQLPPQHLELEITESTLMENIETVVTILEQLHKQGIRVAIDDFGVGYSSLNYIKRLPIDTLKIDRFFITNITNNADDAAIVAAIIAMSHAMGLKVVAEGVEEQEQLQMLQDLKCDQIQGYLFSRPIAEAEATKLLTKKTVALL